jgi:hypothetical protein
MSGPVPANGLAATNTNQMSADSNQHGLTKERFKLGSYYEKKIIQQSKFNEKQLQKSRQRKKWNFENCCKIALDSSCTLKATEIFDCIIEAFPNDEISGVDGIAQSASAKKWEIKFNNSAAFDAACKKTVKIGGNDYNFVDANLDDEVSATKNHYSPFQMTTFFRIHWLPIRFDLNKVDEFIRKEAPFLEVLSIDYEKWSSSPLLNGVIKVKVKYQVENHQHFLDFAGIQEFVDCKALVQLCGMEPKCLFCKKFGHMRKKCPLAGKKCSKCHKIGHELTECNMAKATGSLETFDEMDDDVLAENETVKDTNANSNIDETSARKDAEAAPDNGWFGGDPEASKPGLIPAAPLGPPLSSLPVTTPLSAPLGITQTTGNKVDNTINNVALGSTTNKSNNIQLSANAFSKIKATANNDANKNHKFKKPANMDKNTWRTTELPRLKAELEKKIKEEALANANAAAHAAVKSAAFKRTNSSSLIGDGAEKKKAPSTSEN